MPHEWSDDAENHSEREYEETPDERESREIPDEIEKAAQEAAEEFDRQQEIERMADAAVKEFDEWESRQKGIEDLADAAAKEFDELQRETDEATKDSFENDLERDLDEVRDELHDEYVNDMNRQLEGVSRKDSEVEERSDDGTAQEAAETSESYEDAGTGMVYAMETKSETEEEMQEVSEPGSQNPSEQEPESEDVEESLAEKHTNRIVRHESEESEATTHSDAQEVNEPATSGPSPEVTETEEDKELPEVNKGHSESEPAVSRIEQREYEENVSSIEEGREHSERSELEEKEDEQIEDGIFETVEPVETSAESEELVQDPEESPELCDVREPDPLQNEGSEAEEEPVEKGDSEHETSEDPEVEAEVAQESVEEETLPEGLDDFVERVRELLDERIEEDDDYDYVQDPLTGEIQRVPKILGEYETDEQRQRRKNRNLFAELSGEERERFKELVREKAESSERQSAAAVECAWSQVVHKAEREKEELLERVAQLLDNPEVTKLLEGMAEENKGSHTSLEHAEEDDEDSLEQFIPRTFDEFQETLKQHSKLLKRQNLGREVEQTRIYYECKEELEKTDFSNMSKREVWRHLSQKYGAPANTLKNWFAAGKLPRLLRAVRDELAKAKGVNPHKPRTPTRLSIPETYDEFMSLLARHPYLREVKDFDKLLRDVVEYYKMREIARKSPGLSYSALSRQMDVPFDTARSWIAGRTKPELLGRVLKNERLRRKMESELQAALPMMVDPSKVYEALYSLRSKKKQTLRQIANTLENFIPSNNSVSIVRLKPYNARHGPRWLLDISKKIQHNREQVEKLLNKHLRESGFEGEVRVGIVDNILYLWKRNTRSWDYFELFSEEPFYFKKRFKHRLIQQARERLGLKGNYHFSELMRQITDYKQKGNSKDRIISDFRPNYTYLHGNVLRFLLNSVKSNLKNIESNIEKIGLSNQLIKPKILTEEEIKILFSRLFAIVSSDGSLDSDCRIFYYEDNQTRRNRVKSILSILGIVATPDIRKRDGSIGGFHMPALLGRVLKKLGHPVGDKVLQGVRLPDFIMTGSPEVQVAYLQELIPEEGWITIDQKDNIRIGWARSVVLYDDNKSLKFGIIQNLTSDFVKFIQKHGEKRTRKSKWGSNEEVYFLLNMSKLDRLKEDSNSNVASKAKELDEIVRANPSHHIEDEKYICEVNGIMIGEQSPGPIRYSEASKRVSVRWQVRVSSEDDVALWGLIASPNDYRKRKKLHDWMNRQKGKAEKARKKLKKSLDEIKKLRGHFREKGMSGI